MSYNKFFNRITKINNYEEIIKSEINYALFKQQLFILAFIYIFIMIINLTDENMSLYNTVLKPLSFALVSFIFALYVYKEKLKRIINVRLTLKGKYFSNRIRAIIKKEYKFKLMKYLYNENDFLINNFEFISIKYHYISFVQNENTEVHLKQKSCEYIIEKLYNEEYEISDIFFLSKISTSNPLFKNRLLKEQILNIKKIANQNKLKMVSKNIENF